MEQANQTKTNHPAKITPIKIYGKEYSVDPDWDEVKRGDIDYLRNNNDNNY